MRTRCALAVIALAGCADDPPYVLGDAPPCPTLGDACAGADGAAPALGDVTVVAPSAALPPEVVSQPSHNNLDVAWHGDRLFFAFRTAPTHFADAEAVLYVVSTQDLRTWTFEASFAMGTDLREPRLLSFDGRLMLYFAVLGSVPAAFQPQHAMASEYLGPGRWSPAARILPDLDGFIPWRARTIDGVAHLLGYVGGENIYEPDGEPTRVHWLTTADGWTFAPVVDGQPVVLEGGVSETDLAMLDSGDVIAVARNELGDGEAWGSKVCRAPSDDLGAWTCVDDVRKFDSPIVFRDGAGVWMIARRQVANDGAYDLQRDDLSPADQLSLYQQQYWLSPKRCALWRIDPESLAVEHALDLPSAGDTCFPGVVSLGDQRWLVFNYTSPTDDPDIDWIDGQLAPTRIQRQVLRLPP
jgi:hypothetical protein